MARNAAEPYWWTRPLNTPLNPRLNKMCTAHGACFIDPSKAAPGDSEVQDSAVWELLPSHRRWPSGAAAAEAMDCGTPARTTFKVRVEGCLGLGKGVQLPLARKVCSHCLCWRAAAHYAGP